MSKTLDHDAIEKQAKHIMDSFLKELGSMKEQNKFGLTRTDQMREPKDKEPSEQFQKAFFANAPKVKDNLLIMEKKQW